MRIEYCDQWSIIQKEPFNSIDIEKARQNHINKELYTAIILEDDVVVNTIEITDIYINVRFMNELATPYLSYVFDVKDDENIFHTATYYTLYNEKGNEKLETMAFSFSENGYTVMERRDLVTGEVDERYLDDDDVTSKWDKFPEFGKYEHLLREER